MIGIDLGTTNSCVAVMEGKVSKSGPCSVQYVLSTMFAKSYLVLIDQIMHFCML